jgi:hypothetical protein
MEAARFALHICRNWCCLLMAMSAMTMMMTMMMMIMRQWVPRSPEVLDLLELFVFLRQPLPYGTLLLTISRPYLLVPGRRTRSHLTARRNETTRMACHVN